MSDDLKPGDRVRVEFEGVYSGEHSDGFATVDLADEWCAVPTSAITRITPAEPPAGSVVVKDGVAYQRWGVMGWCTPGTAGAYPQNTPWSDLCDGDVIHRGAEQ